MRRDALSQWDTPQWLARRAVRWQGVPRRHVLEPSAGLGALVAAQLELSDTTRITACELDPLRVAHLRERFDCKPVTVCEGNFLDRPLPRKRFDLALTNPPYENGADGAFVARCMDVSDRVIAILRTNALHGNARYEQVWSRVQSGEWSMLGLAYCVGRPRFSGTTRSPESDFVGVQLARSHLSPGAMCSVEWWHEHDVPEVG